MTILAETAGWNSIITNVLLVVHVVVCLLLCLTVLMQRPKQEGLGAAFGGGMTDQAFGARTTDVLQKGTVYLASLLFVLTLVLSILVGTKSRHASISEELAKSGAAAVEQNGDVAAAAVAASEATEELGAELTAEVEKLTGEAGTAVEAVEVNPTPAEPSAPASEQ